MTTYLDDSLIYSKNEVEHEVHLHQVSEHICEDILFVKYKKCEFRKDMVEYLVQIVG